ncbi:non-ribosomal peptide synthetase [Opitutus terrae]|uniref:Amino acid adenylation domain protein n=1 Tax=Opitutus terrae (strain DSM 11246 / JCM 15787 / PB90-1) TaxID=452637 RepID=B1ZYL2_OPITP|nr:non-ribosomal peptide synthetase [Opitutus terrae]ACB75248.1 amino acid adenylation domain protein [Opitutus terrae PB90-1]
MIEPSQSSPALSPLKRAFVAIEELQARLAAAESAAREPVAIIGIGCRFPGGADTPQRFWELLRDGRDAVTEVPAGRWPVDAFYDEDPAAVGKMTARHGGFLGDIERFDPAFFGISPREAASMDPQQRLLLEVARDALGASGRWRDRLAENPVGVFIGITTAEFGQLQLAAGGLSVLDPYHITGNSLNAAAGRLAFVFGLHGPCMAVDTACSSSLVALHLAMQSVRAGECEMAVAGGVNLILSPLGSIALTKGGVLSSDGRSKTFDAAADGMVRGEGCGLLVLKRLSTARRDGDRVLAVLRGSGVNQDGPSSGLTVPNGPAQEVLLRRVLEQARLESAAVDYLEAHGTGTALGDPIEMGAIGAVYGPSRPADRPLWIGSVKTNIGHLESAAGIASVIKVVLALQHEAIPPHLHFTRPSPHIDWAQVAARVPTTLQSWRRGDRPRVAAVSAFGFSGTNAHVLIEEAPAELAGGADDPRGVVAPAVVYHRERFPLPRPASLAMAGAAAPDEHPLLGRELTLAGTDERRFEATLSATQPGWLGDHRLLDCAVIPAAGWLELAHAAGQSVFGSAINVRDFTIHEPLTLPAGETRAVQTVVHGGTGDRQVEIFDRAEHGWTRHVTAQIGRRDEVPTMGDTLDDVRARCRTAADVDALYAEYAAQGLVYGPAFRTVRALWTAPGEVLAELARSDVDGSFAVAPVLLDGCFQAAGRTFGAAEEVFLPVGAAGWTVYAPAGDKAWAHARVRPTSQGAEVDVTLFDVRGQVVARLVRLRLQRASRAALRRIAPPRDEGVYDLDWPLVATDAPERVLDGDWLVIGDRDGIANRLRAAGADVTTIGANEIAETLGARWSWRGVVCLTALDVVTEAPPTHAVFAAWLAMARSQLVADGVWLVTRDAVAVGAEPVSPVASALASCGRVLQREHPEWSLRLVDVDAHDLAEAMLAECGRSAEEDQVAWRAGQRHAARLAVHEFGPAQPWTVRADATYLITGGWGALGLVTAGWLVERGARHLVLAGRREPGEEARAAVAGWVQRGVRVETRRLDVADRAQVAGLLRELPNLRGIVHAAGAIADGAARQLTPEQFDRVLAAKAIGAQHLDQLAGELDFFVLFSSAAAVLGTPGQANYAAANGYLDGLAHARRARGRPALSIAWAGWSIGLAAAAGDRYAARGIRAITPRRGCRELDRLLATGATQALIWPVMWPTFFASGNDDRVPTLLANFASHVPRRDASDPAAEFRAKLAAAGAATSSLLEEVARAEVGRVLRIAPDKLTSDQPLSTLGLDSIMAVDVRNRLRQVTGADVPIVALLENGTVATVATALGAAVSLVRDAGGAAASASTAGRSPSPHALQPVGEEPLSIGQEALWFLHRAAPESAAYNTAIALRLRGALDRAKVRRVLAALQERHPLLRATFASGGGKPVMRIAATAELAWQEVEANGWTIEQLERAVTADYQRPFALEAGRVFRATLFVRGAADHVLLIGVHHVVGDAWTNWVLLDEFRQLYAGTGPLPAVSGTYSAFVRWQRSLLASREGEELRRWWLQELAGELPTLALPTDFPRPAVLEPQGASVPVTLPGETWQRIKSLARAQQATPFAVLLAAYHVFLHRHTGQEELIVGSPTAGRSRPEFAGIAGYFVNPVPLRARVSGASPFAELLAQVKRTVLGALAHADYPLPELVEALKLARDPSRPALFQTLFVLQKPPQTDARGDALKAAGARTGAAWSGLEVEEFPLAQMEGQFELTLELFEDGAGSFKYNNRLFSAATAGRMARRFVGLIDAITQDPTCRIEALPLLAPEERRLVVQTWNETPAAYPTAHCLHELIAQQATRTPAAPALSFASTALTYAELDARANQLAHGLRRAGVGPDRLVGVCAERSVDLVVALLAVLKAGGAYVPLDPGYPRERLAFMLADSAVPLVLTQDHLREGLRAVVNSATATAPRLVALDAEWPEIAREPTTPPASGVTPSHLAYMIYTSGSTGRPKGALNTHRAIVNRLLWMQDAYRLTAADTVMQKTPFSFDVSVWEFFWPLLAGARLVVAQPGGHQDAAYLADLAARERVTTMHFVPSMLQLFVEQPGLARCAALRQVFCSGEALPFELQERFFARHAAELHNLYGPTEAAVDVTAWRCERGSRERVVPIGRPIARTRMYVLDPRMQPVPIGVAGELYIGGIAVGRGYHGRPELTAEKFVPDPFGTAGERLYRTGDRARWRPDGAIEYLGRLDFQVKLRGFRIELGEIESALRALAGVSAAAVLVREDQPGDQALVAYVVAAGVPGDAAGLRGALRKELPEYMVPAEFVFLPALPLSPNGKLDRRALPAPARGRPETGAGFRVPESATEQILSAIWAEVLGRGRVGVEDNFFDLGGHSLKLGQVHAQLTARFPSAPSLLELFQYPTIRALAARLDGPSAAAPANPPLPPPVAAAPARGEGWIDQRAIRRAAREGSRR